MGKLQYTISDPDLLPEYYAYCQDCGITTENSADRERVEAAWNKAMGGRQMTDEQANNITREQAIRILHPDTNIEAIDDYEEAGNYEHAYDTACLMAVDALRQPGWVRTADRVPTEEDGKCDSPIDERLVLECKQYRVTDGENVKWVSFYTVKRVENVSNFTPFVMRSYWMPLPKLPEVEG